MVRPRKVKQVNFRPSVTYFKPRSVPLNQLEEIELTIDELETLRLSSIDKMNQVDSAKKMNIHQSTFQRTLTRAREKIANALVNGKAIKIYGGNYKMPGRDGTGPFGQNSTAGRGRGMGRPSAAGPDGTCICPKCGHEETHIRGTPCANKKCPDCGSMMTRK